ncbi:MAG: FAD-binding domain-containing protein [Pseudomonadales bacterium]|jgi:deoxyribodipyrimidine photo-lyase|nr:FAD-binding domain-containing protein [Pseudomonadales bacterium]
MRPVSVVWLKRDLRLHDHAALAAAAAEGPVLPLYVVEPSLWQAPDADAQHWRWVRASLEELAAGLAARGAPLLVRRGEVVDVLADLHRRVGIRALHSHQETGLEITFARDRAVGALCRAERIPWTEHLQFGAFRRLGDRDGWSRRWEALMTEPEHDVPERLDGVVLDGLVGEPLPALPVAGLEDLHPAASERRWDQAPGERAGLARLDSFLAERGAAYHREMSSPLTAADACSRLSAALAWGNVSMRRIVARTRAAQRDLKEHSSHTAAGLPYARGALVSFSSRLHWHCHFMQKLEYEPALEFHCFNRAVDDVRPRPGPAGHLEAWCTGTTGLPFVDACMRQLQTTGWINFRMRAMLVATAAYHLWLDWREFRDFLARQFVDYEPGIHVSQIQMQSGVTGINTLRIYNPVKQGHDQDPEGEYIRRWVPELAGLDGRAIHEPWTAGPIELAALGIELGRNYPERIVDHVEAAREARRKLGTALSTPEARKESERVMREHGSRKGGDRRRNGKGSGSATRKKKAAA